jgi:hypothetical protein
VVTPPLNDRGRVPFAVLGVLLLVTSAGYHASLGTTPAVREPATETAMERAGAATVPALRTAVRRAARAAAADPVITRANTSVGRALNGSQPFRDALALRIYLAARARLDAATVREGDVTATVGVPAIPNASTAAVRRAVERVRVRRAGPNGSRLRVRLSNVTLAAARGGRTLTRESFSPSVTVSTPVLALHDRTARYERRLDAATRSPESAGARVTAGAHLIVAARGTAQWAGAPVANVLGNRHLALATEAAVYDTQARTFGRRDPQWATGFATTAARTVGRDAAAAAFEGVKGRTGRGQTVALGALKTFLVSESRPVLRDSSDPFGPEMATVDAGRSADAALADLLRPVESGPRNLTRVLRAAYTVDATVAARTHRLGSTRSGRRRPAVAGDWRLVDRSRTVERDASNATGGDRVSIPAPSGHWHRLASARRLVVERTTTVRRWRDGNRTTTTSHRRTRRHRVAIALLGRHRGPGRAAPSRPITPVHEPGGALGGPNLAGIAGRARDSLGRIRGGFDRVATRAVAGRLDDSPFAVTGQRPAGLEARIVRDLMALHRRVRNVSVRASRRGLGTFRATPAAELAAQLRSRRAQLLDPPRAYDGVAERARLAARAAYLERTIARLEARAERRQRARGRLNKSLTDRGLPGLARIEAIHRAAANATDSDSVPADRQGVQLVPDATPTRLALTDVARADAGLHGSGSVRPLAARNLNVFTLPFDDAASFVRGGEQGTVPLATAARALRGAASLPPAATNDSLAADRARLRRSVADRNARLRSRARVVLRRAGIEGSTRRFRLVGAALDRWESPAARALAFTNGSAARRVAVTASDHIPTGRVEAGRTSQLSARLRTELRRALSSGVGRVPREPVERTDRLVRDLADAAVTETVAITAERGSRAVRERVYDSAARTVPAGLPVLPPVQPWYATVNVWHVHVRGVHPSLVVRARGRGRPGPSLAYERDGHAVHVDVDGDGDGERLGRARRVSFDIETVVLVAVPPGGRGVGDTDGNADERTGWPAPEPWPAASDRTGAPADGGS